MHDYDDAGNIVALSFSLELEGKLIARDQGNHIRKEQFIDDVMYLIRQHDQQLRYWCTS